MSAPKSPITNLAGLIVFVFLMAGAAAPRQPVGHQDSQQRVTAADEFAGSFAALAPAASPGAAQFRLLKVRDMMEAPAAGLFAAPALSFPRQFEARGAAPCAARRLSLVGMIELRI